MGLGGIVVLLAGVGADNSVRPAQSGLNKTSSLPRLSTAHQPRRFVRGVRYRRQEGEHHIGAHLVSTATASTQ